MDIEEQIKIHLGRHGRMIGGSKSGYRRANPDNYPIFNANIIAETPDGMQKVWYGDLDLTTDETAINASALDSGTTLYVLREMDGRFNNENKPDLSNYVYKTDGTEHTIPNVEYGQAVRNDKGQIVQDNG